METTIKATFVLCPACGQPLIVVDGEVRPKVTFFNRDGHHYMTPHTNDCENRGKTTPKE